MMKDDDAPSELDLEDIQGNLVGFNKDRLRLLFVTFPDQASGQRFMAAMVTEVDDAATVLAFNDLYKRNRQRNKDPLSVQSSGVNLHLTFAGMTQIGADGLDSFPEEFRVGMRARAADNGDVDDSDPSKWVDPFGTTSSFALHAMVLVAADSPALLDERTSTVRAIFQASGVTELASATQDGQTRPGDNHGHEHFGFKDGISQPSIEGVTRSSKGGDDIAPGEFLIGYEDQEGHVSGQALPPSPVPTPGQPGYPAPPPPPPPAPMPDWCRNSTFGVYRRLRQNVGAFRQFLSDQAASAGLNQDQLGAKLVGRWPSGAPLENVAGDAGFDPTTADPKDTNPEVVEDEHINNFGYHEHDQDGHLTPKAAHIRKAYPRDSEPPGREESNRHRIARRGIPYGPDFVPGEPAYGTDPIPDSQDRGRLFICYQASIARGFEFIQRSWANANGFPETGDGQDPIISQNAASPAFPLPGNPHLVTQRWVITTGGEYFFVPSISAMRHLGGQS